MHPYLANNLVKKKQPIFSPDLHPNFLTFQRDPNFHDWFWWPGYIRFRGNRTVLTWGFLRVEPAFEVYSALRDVDDDLLMELRTRTWGDKTLTLGTPFCEIYQTIPAPDPLEPASMNLVCHATQRGAETFALLGWDSPERKRSCKIYEIAVEAGFKFT